MGDRMLVNLTVGPLTPEQKSRLPEVMSRFCEDLGIDAIHSHAAQITLSTLQGGPGDIAPAQTAVELPHKQAGRDIVHGPQTDHGGPGASRQQAAR